MEPAEARVEAIARRALERLGTPASAPAQGGAHFPELRITRIDMPQLVHLVYLQAGDPLVDQVLASLKAGRPVYLDRPAIETALGLAEYPPRLQEQFNRWFSRLAGYGIALVANHPSPLLCAPAGAPRPRSISPVPSPFAPPFAPPVEPPFRPRPSGATLAHPEQAIFSEILGEAVPEPHPCVKEPGRPCCGSGRCKTLGF